MAKTVQVPETDETTENLHVPMLAGSKTAETALKAAQSPEQRQWDEEIATVRARLAPLEERAQAAADAMIESLRTFDPEIAPLMAQQPFYSQVDGRVLQEHADLDRALNEYKGVRTFLKQLRGTVPQEIQSILDMPASYRQGAIERLSHMVANWCEVDVIQKAKAVRHSANKLIEKQGAQNYAS